MHSGHAVPLPTGVTLFTSVSPGPADRALLVVHGGPDWDHTYLRDPLSGQAAARIPRATAVVLPEADHMAHVDDPRAWMRALRSFLVTENDRPPGPRG